jgi:hypothetical protein
MRIGSLVRYLHLDPNGWLREGLGWRMTGVITGFKDGYVEVFWGLEFGNELEYRGDSADLENP